MKHKRLACGIAAICLLLAGCAGALPERAPGPDLPYAGDTGRLQLECDRETGRITVRDALTGKAWSSPSKEELENETSKGASRFALESNLIAYTVKPGPNDSILSQGSWASYTDSVSVGGLTVEEIAGGYRLTYVFDRAGLVIPLDVKIVDDALVASVRREDIRETGDNRLCWLSVLPYFGAGSGEDEGYLVIPDGSGAIVNFNNMKSGYKTYREAVYGFDLAYAGISAPQLKKTIHMPVFGIEKNGSAMLGVITKGTGSAWIEAHTGGQVNGYNAVYPRFDFIISDQILIGSLSDGQSRSVEKYAYNDVITDEIEIRYFFPEADGYSGMAGEYREYLIASGQAAERETKAPPPLYVGFFGGLRKQESVVGILVQKYKAMTTFAEAGGIIDELARAGVGDLIVVYENWTEQQAGGTLQNNAEAASQLGGNKGKAEFEKKLGDMGGKAYFSFDPLEIGKTSLSFLSFVDSARKIGGSPILLYQYSPANGYLYVNKPAKYLPSYAKLGEAVGSFIASAEKNGVAGIYYPTLASELYSSYSPKNFINRENALDMQRTLLALGEADKMGKAANAYAFGEMSHILAAPATTTLQNMADESIPFYQLVVSGLAGYSTPCVNIGGDLRLMTLKAIETGAGLYFSWVCSDPSAFMETQYDYLYGSDYRRWIGDAADGYAEARSAFEQIGGGRFVSH